MVWAGRGIERELRRLHQDMDRAFPRSARGGFPAVNIMRSEHGVLLTAEVPGIEAKDIDVTVKGSTLTLQISREQAQGEDVMYQLKERFGGKAARTIELPFEVEAGAAKARFDHGVLYLELPQAEAERPIKITVN